MSIKGSPSKYTKSDLCQMPGLNLSCIGCCGVIKGTKEELIKALDQNTAEFKTYTHPKDMHSFIWRYPTNNLRRCGICPNIVNDDVRTGIKFCPGHPERNGDKDIRDNYCDILHVCKTAFFFDLWDAKEKARFIDFIKKKVKRKELDWYSYSVKMDNDELLIEFEDLR